MCKENNIVTVGDLQFRHYITSDEIQESLKTMAEAINKDYAGKIPVFLVVLNGAFMFSSDLLKYIQIECEVEFVRVSSYHGTETTGNINQVLGLNIPLKNREVLVLEDIIDTGITMEYILKDIKSKGVAGVRIASLLFKKGKFQKDYPIDYIGFSIPNAFVVGYGLDYNGLGRNLKDIYTVVE
jgi:hypoxanthine phosphoribosyltransferase